MRQPNRDFTQGWMWFILVAALAMPHTTDAFGSSLIYKNFVVRYDRGWDILCEPYVVKKDDWVLKIFKQKGEIAHKDFRDFLGIFKRLNPHIKDIDLIRPGQGIDIPLRKIEHGSMTGQELGVVTIPFVSLADVTEIVKQHSDRYTVKRGDTVSKLLASKYGAYSTKSYGEGIKLFKAANPEVTDLNKIYTGQTLYLPDPGIREKAWYSAMYDDQGNLREKMDQNRVSETGQESPAAAAKPFPPMPPPKPAAPPKGRLAEAAEFVGGKLQAKGTYYLPRDGESDFEIDLSKHPALELGKGPKLIFTLDNTIMGMDKDAFQSNWPDMKPVSVEKNATTEQYVSAIFAALEESTEPAGELAFENQGVRVAVRAKWVRSENQDRQLCITPIANADQQTPESIRRYLEQNGIVLKEILPGGAAIEADPSDLKRHAIKNILAIPQTNPKEFVVTMAKTLGFTYVPNTSITFPYAGIQVQAYANLLSAKSGREALVDFGDLYGDAVTAIGQTGLKVVQITPEESFGAIVQKLFSALSIEFEQHPTLLAARRPAEYNIAITINGLLYANDENRRVLLTGADLHSAVTDLLSDREIDVIVW
ncbi:MAG: LysM peptidoglycan-binding domain-containing protein [Desulfobacteraceae bacterium]